MARLLRYDYEIIYQLGKSNTVADALSWRAHAIQAKEKKIAKPSIHILTSAQAQVWEGIAKEAQSYPYMQKLEEQATTNLGNLFLRPHRLILFKNRVVVPPSSPLISQSLHEFHNTPSGGHAGVLRTFKRLSQVFYWPSMLKIVESFVALCDICQRAKASSLLPIGVLHPLHVPKKCVG